jgi:hypothetical protein
MVLDSLRSWNERRGTPLPAGQAPTEQQIEEYREYMRVRASGVRQGDPRLARFGVPAAPPTPPRQQEQQRGREGQQAGTGAARQEAGQQAVAILSRQQRRALERQQQKEAAKAAGLHGCPKC